MKMNLPSTPVAGTFQTWARLARRVAALGLMAVGLGSVHAQIASSTLAGSALQSGTTDNTGSLARFSTPIGVAVDSVSGNVYVADSQNHTIRKVVIATGAVTTIAGAAGVTGTADGTAGQATSVARFNTPSGLALDGAGNLFVADTGNHTVRKIVLSTNTVTTVAGTAGSLGYVNAVAPGTGAKFFNPIGIAVDRTGGASNGAAVNVFVADTSNHVIRQVVLSTGAVTTLAGGGGATPPAAQSGNNGGSPNGTGAAAYFNAPKGIAVDFGGTTVYVADTNNNLIRKIVVAGGGVVTTFAGSGTAGSSDGNGVAATFNQPYGLTIDNSAANLYVADTVGQVIRQIVVANPQTVTTILGTANSVQSTDGVSTAARFNNPQGIAVSSTGVLYIADTLNQTIRVGGPTSAPNISVQPANTTFTIGVTSSTTFSVTASGTPAVSYQWQRQPAAGGGFANLANGAANGLTVSGVTTNTLTITGAATTNNNDQFQVVVSNGVNPAATSSPVRTLTVNQQPTITSASGTTFSVNSAGTFTVTATGSPAPSFSVIAGNFPSFASLNSSTGVISGTPLSAGGPYIFTIQASNTVGTAATQSFTLTVASGPSISVQPTNQTVGAGASAQFSVTASSATSYQWLRQAAGGSGFSTISDNGIYSGTGTATLTVNNTTLAMSGDQFQVNTINSVGTTPSSAATLSITQAPNITSLNTATYVENTFGSFTIQATGSPASTFSLTSGSLPSGLTLTTNAGANTATLSGTPATNSSTSSPYSLQFTATNGVNPAATQSFTLTVSPTALVPVFTTQPANLSVALGQTATFTVVATGTPAPTYIWQRQLSGTSGFNNLSNDSTFSGVQTATLTITNPSSGMSGDQYMCVASNTSGNTNSSVATLTVVVGTTITTFAGQAASFGSTDATGTAARFNTPASLAISSNGTLYVADSSNHVIRKITSAGVVTTLAGSAGISGSVDGVGSAARFNSPSGITVDSVGNIYVADTYNHTIRAIAADGTVTTLAGLAGNSGSADGSGSTARFSYPGGITVDSGSTIYVADTFNHTIRRIVSGTVSTFSGSAGVRGNTDSPGRFAYPNALAVDSSGNVYVADSFNQTIRKITSSAVVSTLAGSAGTIGTTDGTGSSGLFNQPSGIAVDSSANVYVADTGSNTIRKVTPGGVVTTLAGLAGSSGSADGSGSTARFNAPFGLAVDSSGNIFIADTRNHTIRRSGSVSAPSIQTHPQNVTAGVGQNTTFTVTATGAPTPTIFQWQRQAAGTTGYTNLSNDSTYSGTTTATLTVTGVTAGMSGDQFVVIVTNLISPNATSNAATLTTVPPPVFTSAASTTFNVGQVGSFTVTATSSTSVVYASNALPVWLTLNSSTGVLSGTPPDASGSPIAITLSANNGATTTQNFSLTLVVPVVAPAITTQPAGAALNPGDNALFTIGVTGTAPLTYQWSKNGIPITGATSNTFSIVGVQLASAGSYSVVVTNSIGSATSNGASLVVNATPVILTQPRAQTVVTGSSVTLLVTATGSPAPTYQWRLNGAAIAGANSPSYTIASAQAANAGNYDVLIGNAFGQVLSSLAQLSVVSTATAPTITSSPPNRTVLVGAATTLSVSVSGAPAPSYQWRKNGVAIPGATAASYSIGFAQTGDTANYDVVVSNSAGTVVSSAAAVNVIRRSYAGTYFGSFGTGLGTFAIYVRTDNTGVFLGYLPGSNIPVKNLGLTVSDTGQISFTQSATGGISASSFDSAGGLRAAAPGDIVFAAAIATDGSLSGTVSGVAGASLTAAKAIDNGATQAVAGFYSATAANSSSTLLSIAGAAGQAFVLTQTSTSSDGGTGAVSSTGVISLATSRQVVNATINASTSAITGTSLVGGSTTSYSGASEAVIATQRLGNISTRANVGTGNNVAIAGFVISGNDSKPVLIRAIGPTMSVFGFSNPLGAPKLDLYSGSTVISTNTGWSTATNTAAIVAASAQAGAFPLSSSSADSVILTTLAPGNYTAIVGSANGGTGVALIEVYDLSAATTGQKLFNISTRANAGTGLNTLAAGFVINGVSPKRLLIRGVGPGLVQLNVAVALTQTQLQIINSANTVVAQNTGWGTSADASAIATSAAQVGAFPLVAGSGDSALIVSLAPGNYTAQLNPVGSAGGIAIIEVYELP